MNQTPASLVYSIEPVTAPSASHLAPAGLHEPSTIGAGEKNGDVIACRECPGPVEAGTTLDNHGQT